MSNKVLNGLNKLHWLELTRLACVEPELLTHNILWMGNEKLPSYSQLMEYLDTYQPLNIPPYYIIAQYGMATQYDLIEYTKDIRLEFRTADNRVHYICRVL